MTTTRRFGGTGLGLAISKRIVELLGGSVGCCAEPGLGANFRCSIPAPVVAMPERRLPPIVPGGRVVLIGGSPARRAEIGGMLVPLGLSVDTAATAEAAASLPGRDHWQALVVMASSDEDGLIQGLGHWRSRPLIVLADSGAPRIRYRAYRAGAVSVLADPQDLSDLPYVLASATRKECGGEQGRAEATVATDWADRRPILVIDDTATNRELTARQLRRLGLTCDMAENGQVGLDMAVAGSYALILVDGSMPVMDGPSFASHFRTLERRRGGKRTPLIAMTAHALAGDADRFLAAGMDDYLAKPVTLRKLEKMLRTWLADRQADAVPAAADDGHAGDETIDLAALAAMLGENNSSGLAELLQVFVADFPPMLDRIADALSRRDCGALTRAAHAAKSAAGSAAATGLAGMMARLEQAASTADPVELQQFLAAAEQAFGRVATRSAGFRKRDAADRYSPPMVPGQAIRVKPDRGSGRHLATEASCRHRGHKNVPILRPHGRGPKAPPRGWFGLYLNGALLLPSIGAGRSRPLCNIKPPIAKEVAMRSTVF